MRLLSAFIAFLAVCLGAHAQLLPVAAPLAQRGLPYGVSVPAVTSSSVSYPGCPGEVSSHTNTWYFDQVNGHTQSGGGTGAVGAPWDNLQALTGNNAGTPTTGYTQILLSTAPGGNGSSPVKAGDLILVNTGSYGAVTLGSATAIVNSPAITIKANTSQTPSFTTLDANEMTGLHLEGLKVQGAGAGGLVQITDNNVAHSTSDIILENMDISSASVATADTWSRATWISNARPGVQFYSEAGENPSTAMTCVSVVNSHIYVVSSSSQFGAIELESGSSLIQGNEIDHFYSNGIKFYESNYAIGRNYIHDAINTGQGQSIDYALFQGIDSTLDPSEWQSNIYFYNNKAIENADASLPSTFQAALSFYLNSTGDITNFVAWDNLMDGSGSCAICTGNIHNAVIANNSSMYSGGIGGQNPIMNFTQEHAGAAGFGTGPLGRAPSNVWAFNNIGNIFECLNGLQCYHNISAPGSTGFSTWTYLSTNPAGPTAAPGPGWYVTFASPTPGSVVTLSSDSGQQNLIDGGVGGGSPQANEFASVPVAGSWPELPLPDWTPKSGSPAATAGGVQLAPPITDYNGNPFVSPFNIGALAGTTSTASCTGGTHTSSGSNTIITFTSSGTLTCSGSFSASALVVAGGGGGSSAGGGAGGYCTTVGTPTCSLGASITIPSGATTVTVGGGGAASSSGGVAGSNGSNSVLGSIVTATGGGGGGPINANNTGGGGSGGGAGSTSASSTTGGVATQGNNGGAGVAFGTPFAASGGGGAGAVGGADSSATVAGVGGNGVSNSITGSAVTYAGGGGGGNYASPNSGGAAGGSGGGGNGGISGGAGFNGTANTGGGGGGSGNIAGGTGGGTGGSGIVIISCLTSACGS